MIKTRLAPLKRAEAYYVKERFFMKLSLYTLVKLIGTSLLFIAIGYHFAYFYLDYNFSHITSKFGTPLNHETYSTIDLDNHYYIEAYPPLYGTLTGQLTVTSTDGNYKLIIWRKFPKETTSTFQVFSNKSQNFLSYPLEIKNDSIDLEFTNLSIEKQIQITNMEKEAKDFFGNNILENTL